MSVYGSYPAILVNSVWEEKLMLHLTYQVFFEYYLDRFLRIACFFSFFNIKSTRAGPIQRVQIHICILLHL
jgi:hypothetical protein